MFTNERTAGAGAEHLVMKDQPAGSQPYELCLRYGPEVLSDAQLLAAVIRCGAPGLTASQLAEQILRRGRGHGLESLYHLSLEELMSFPGIGRVKAVQLKCIGELSRRIARSRADAGAFFSDPRSVADYYMEDMRHLEQEQVLLVMLNQKKALIGETVISKGTVDSSLLSPREVFKTALSRKAVAIILLHNHPSGDPTPSGADIAVTRQIAEGGELLGVRLLDHVIIGDGVSVSLRELGYF